jgi:AcrR family transcriptional regulator
MTADAAAVRRRPKDRKQQILVQARELFLELGYPNVSMAMIADRVGVTAGGLYRHFSTKADLLEAVVRDAFRTVAPPVPGLALDELIDREITAVAGRSNLADLWSREVRYLPEQVRRDIRAMMRETARAYLAPLKTIRPRLTLVQAEMIAWSVQSVLSCLGRDSVRLPPAGGQALIRGAVRALPTVPLAAPAAAQLFSGAGQAYADQYGIDPSLFARISVKARRHAPTTRTRSSVTRSRWSRCPAHR